MRAIAASACLLSLMGCMEVPIADADDRPASYALADPGVTHLGRLLSRHAPDAVGSGFAVLSSGRDALLALHGLASVSQKTLDVQYYIWRKDDTGRALLATLLQAADRGVRVRMLLDDWEPSWTDDELATLDAHPNFEVRLYNPSVSRSNRFLSVLLDFPRITHRMHNKAFIADNVAAIVGGRNIGDRYFSVSGDANFRDLGLFAAGQITRGVSESFDAYWNSPWSLRLQDIGYRDRTPGALGAMARQLEQPLHTAGDIPLRQSAFMAPHDRVEARFSRLIWAESAVVAVDPPDKPATSRATVLRELQDELVDNVDRELLIEVAYLVPRSFGVEALCHLARRGIRLHVLTNSLESSDAVTTYAGYQDSRKQLLRCGIDLYEMRGDGGMVERDRSALGANYSAHLHSKAAVGDNRHVFVGSFNADPRSVNLNTEIALLIDSPALAEEVSGFIRDGMSPLNAYRVSLEGEALVWHSAERGHPVASREEPGRTFWRGLYSDLLSILPIEGQL